MGRPINSKKYSIEASDDPSSALWFMAIFSGETDAEDASLVKQLGTDTVRLRSVATGAIEDFTLTGEEATEPGQAYLLAYQGSSIGQVVKLMQHRANVYNWTEEKVIQYRHNFSDVGNNDDDGYVFFDVLVGPETPTTDDWTLEVVTGPDISLTLTLTSANIGSHSLTKLEYTINDGEIQEIPDVVNMTENVIITDATNGTYNIRIRFVTNISTSEWSDIKSVVVNE